MRCCNMGALYLSVIMLVGLWVGPPALAEEKPRYGGIMKVAIAGDPPSLDMHQESTFKVFIPMSNVYNGLVVFDPHGYPTIIGDLAKSWTVSDDGMIWTFKLHQGVKFHDGSELTSADAKASWDRIVFPTNTVSVRKSFYQAVKSIEAPDRYTIVFRLKYPSASFLTMLARGHNFIFAKKYLDQDPHWYKTHAMGTGPFKLKKIVRGSYIEVERNPDYFKPGLPYLDGIKYYQIKDLSARAKSIRTGRTHVELRGFPPAEVAAIKEQMGDRVVVRFPKAISTWGVAFNVNHKPFDDVRVRRAMSLALDRYEMAKVLGPLTGLETVGGGLMHPDTPWALSSEELQALPGFSKDYETNLKEAKRLLAEAGYPDGFKTVLTNRSVKLPYIDFGVYLVSAWKKIGVEAEHRLEESATWYKNRRTGNFVVLADPYLSATTGDPDELMVKFVTGSSTNYGGISDPEVDRLFEQQKVELNEQKRIELVKEMQKIIIDKAYFLPCLWMTRIEVRSALIRNYEPHHSHHMNRRMEDVWLAKE